MSAPETDPKRQARRHKIPIIGIVASLVFAFVVAVVLIGVMDEGETTGAAPDVNPVMEDQAADE